MVAKLSALIDDDPVLAAAFHAPLVEATVDEMAAFEEGMRDIRAGRVVSADQIRSRLRASAPE